MNLFYKNRNPDRNMFSFGCEDSTQYKIRTEQEREVAQKTVELYQILVVLNMIHNGGSVFGDKRSKKNIRLEKELAKYLGMN